ncbi:MAG: hypothetical protein HY695_18485, partial [Deltaproteobacteria bacterium]|nr:hypothetical protein [Deltaproteobacteria bacterium]
DGINFTLAISVSGTVVPLNDVNGGFTFNSRANGVSVASGDGSFTGSLSGNTLTINISGEVETNETCHLTGTLTGNK